MNHRPHLLAASCLLAMPLQAGAASFDCLLEPSQTVEIRSAVEGLIHRIHVQRGDEVKAGQTVVELDAALERSALAVARFRAQADGRIVASKNRMEYAQRKTKRSDELHGGNFLSAQARDEAETERRLAEAELKEAMENQELARIRRPPPRAGGVVATGQYVVDQIAIFVFARCARGRVKITGCTLGSFLFSHSRPVLKPRINLVPGFDSIGIFLAA